jgi:hypothetical protein
VLGLFGSISIAILAAKGSLCLLLGPRRTSEPSDVRLMPRLLPWLAGHRGTSIGGGSAFLSAW